MSTGALFSVTCHRNCVEEMEKTGKSRKYSENSFWEQLKLPECTWIEKYVSCIKKSRDYHVMARGVKQYLSAVSSESPGRIHFTLSRSAHLLNANSYFA